MGDPSIKLKFFEGIPIKKSAKYLGLNYNHSLSLEFSIQSIKPKVNFIKYKLNQVLKNSDFRTRYNCWQIFVMPLISMLFSLCGHPGSHRSVECIKRIQLYMRSSLKKFLYISKCSPSFIINELIYSEKRIQEYLLNLDRKVEIHIGKRWEEKHPFEFHQNYIKPH